MAYYKTIIQNWYIQDTSQKHYPKWKKLDSKDKLMYNSIYKNCGKDKTIISESRSVDSRAQVYEKGMNYEETQGNLGGDGNALYVS